MSVHKSRLSMLHGQRGFIPAFLIPYIGYALAGLAVVAILGFLIGKYNDGIRDEATKPLKQQITQMKDAIEANKIKAAALLNAKIAENKQLKEKSDADAKQKDADYAKLLARFNARGLVGVRDLPAGCGQGSGSAGQAGTDSAGTPEKPTSGSGTGDAGRELVFTEGAVATVIQWYAYGLSCHAFVNAR